MKKLPIKYIQGLCSFGIIFFVGGPFLKIPEQPLDNGYIPNNRLSGFDFVFENLEGYFTNAFPAPNINLVLIAFTVAIVILMQLVAGLTKRDKLIISTAFVMFGIMLAGLVYIMQSNLPVVVRWGYYVFMALQLVLGLFTPVKPVEAKEWINKS